MAMCNSNTRRHTDNKNIYPVTEKLRSRRIALLISNINFIDQRLTRHNANKDEEAMVNLLQTLGYEVERYRNLSAQIDEALKTFSRHPKLAFTDSVFVVLMSHGGLRSLWGSDCNKLDINTIYERLSTKSCPALKDKPKVIIIQASRGVYVQGRTNPDMDLVGHQKLTPGAQVPIDRDFISLHCTAPHISTYRHLSFSSFFIQNFFEVFTGVGRTCHIDELFKKVIERFYCAGAERKMPIMERCTLMKYFYPFAGMQPLSAGQELLSMKAASHRVEPAVVRWDILELRKYSSRLMIDANTVNRKLKVSDSSRKVTYVTAVQPYPDHPDRFDRPQLLCLNAVTARCYWEVQWTGEVSIAVSYKGITRKGEGNKTLFGWNNQSWSLYCSDKYTAWHDGKETALSHTCYDSCKVGVYVDCHAGTLSFFSVSSNTLTHLHTFKTKFAGPVYPGFRVFTASKLHL
ncbi:caspase-4-like isoform X2 [Archocentrus centrarchus]|uniref:caspase-4-like isoform X2 n=1 Tax=Archocentrus centrarchus TaxID=63155 RepID=UPI0011EA27AE|nr:caspase-4-like isoform X2 [Archocentrus centrarchus]